MAAVQAHDGTPSVGGSGGSEPLRHGQQPVGPGRDQRRGGVEGVLQCCGPVVGGTHARADQVAQPGDRPHAAPDARALVQVPTRDAGQVAPRRGGGRAALAAHDHAGGVGAEGDQHVLGRAQPGAERLDGLVVRGGDHRQPARQPGVRRGPVRHAADHRTGQHQLDQPLALLAVRRRAAALTRPVPPVRVEGPVPLVGRGGVGGPAGEPQREVARGRGDPADPRRLGVALVRPGDPLVHPADHGCRRGTVAAHEGPGVADAAQAQSDQVLR